MGRLFANECRAKAIVGLALVIMTLFITWTTAIRFHRHEKRSIMGATAFERNGLFSPKQIALILQTTPQEIARTVGLADDEVLRIERIRSNETQRRLRDLVEIINKVAPRFGSELVAYAWLRSIPLPGFSGWTANQLIRDGKADEVLKYFDAVDAGVHA